MIVVVILPTVNMKSITFNRFVHVHSLALIVWPYGKMILVSFLFLPFNVAIILAIPFSS